MKGSHCRELRVGQAAHLISLGACGSSRALQRRLGVRGIREAKVCAPSLTLRPKARLVCDPSVRGLRIFPRDRPPVS